jgi:pimeloyl-ACP methyl ester carboxylesterase
MTTIRETAAVFLPALRELRRRREPRGVTYAVPVRTADGISLDCRLVAGDPRKVVVVAHPAVVGSRYAQVVDLADELSSSCSVLLFDFRGHGRSGGRCRLGFTDAATDITAVIGRARGLGFAKVGVAGFSLGAAAAVLAASDGVELDALAAIGCPPSFPDITMWNEHPILSRAALRGLGMRIDRGMDDGATPVDAAADLGDFPKLLVFGEWEVVPAEELDSFTRKVAPPVETITIPGVWHADLAGREPEIREWFEAVM